MTGPGLEEGSSSAAAIWYPGAVTKRQKSDSFETRYMTGDGDVRHRDKRVSRGMAILLAIPALFTLALAGYLPFVNATAARPVPAAALPLVVAGLVGFAAMFAVLSLTFAVLRTVVTSREVIVKYGLWGARIPIEAITSCKVVPYKWTQFGGWGIRRGIGGVWAYVPGAGDVVEIAYTENGKTKRVQVGANNPQLIASEIQHARQAARTGLRIDAAEDDEQAAIEAEQEAAATEEAQATEAKHSR